jgi:hypothetical membrane protein
MSTRVLLACGVIAPVLFVLTFLVDGATRPGYNAWRNAISQLSTGERGWLQIANFVVCGALVLLGTVGLWRSSGWRVATVLIGLFAVALIAVGIFVVDPGLGYPPGARALPQPSLQQTIHELASLVVFLALGLAPLAVALHDARSSPAWAGYSLLSGIIVLGFFAATVAVSAQQDILSDDPIGLLQRISVVAGFAWLAALFTRLRRVNTG